MTNDLEVSAERDGAFCIVSVAGDLDLYTSPVLKDRLVELVEDGRPDVVIDLSGVGFVDSSGLGVLVGILRRAKERDGSVRLAGVREAVAKTFRITGLDKVFPMFATVDEARGY